MQKVRITCQPRCHLLSQRFLSQLYTKNSSSCFVMVGKLGVRCHYNDCCWLFSGFRTNREKSKTLLAGFYQALVFRLTWYRSELGFFIRRIEEGRTFWFDCKKNINTSSRECRRNWLIAPDFLVFYGAKFLFRSITPDGGGLLLLTRSFAGRTHLHT